MERITWDLARKIRQSADVTILTTIVPGRPREFVIDDIHVSTISGCPSGKYSVRWWLSTARYRAAKKYDVVFSASAAAASMVQTQRGPKYILQAHGTALREFQNALRVRPRRWYLKAARYAYWILIDRVTYQRVSMVIAASEQVGRALNAIPYRGAWRHTDLSIMPNAVDTEHFEFDSHNRDLVRQRLGLRDNDVAVVTISRLDRQKAVDRVIAAVAISGPNIHLLVGGTGPELDRLRTEARGIHEEKRAQFLGQLDYNTVRNTLHAGDVFVLPVRNFEREALPVAALEALASGLRVLVPQGSSWPFDLAELIEFVDMDDVDALRGAISSVQIRNRARPQLPNAYSTKEWARELLDQLAAPGPAQSGSSSAE